MAINKIDLLFEHWNSLPPYFWENPTVLFNHHLHSTTLPGIQWYRKDNDLFYTVELVGDIDVSAQVYPNVTIYRHGTRFRIERHTELVFPWTKSGKESDSSADENSDSVQIPLRNVPNSCC